MKDAKTAVLFDLDSTLCDTQHRWHLSPLHNPDASWGTYAAACEGDDPIPGTLRAVQVHYPHHQVHICSNRPETAGEPTRRWLEKHGVAYDFLSLAPSAPHGSKEEAVRWCANRKTGYIRSVMARGGVPVLFYDDQADMAEIVYSETAVPFVVVKPPYPGTWSGRE